jgi:hypothetical protein
MQSTAEISAKMRMKLITIRWAAAAGDDFQHLVRELEALLLGERGQILRTLARPGLLLLLG